jgi:DNA-directed RNA polymerase subunit RPC12/RpoP
MLPPPGAAARPSSIKPPDRCPYCNSARLIKKGARNKKLETVPLYRCRSCGRTFAPGPRAVRNKTHPLAEILEAFAAVQFNPSLWRLASPPPAGRVRSLRLLRRAGVGADGWSVGAGWCSAGRGGGWRLRCRRMRVEARELTGSHLQETDGREHANDESDDQSAEQLHGFPPRLSASSQL